MTVNLRGLIGKLNAPTRNALEGAAGLCLSRTHYDVEIEHFLLKALDATDGDLAFILKHYGVNRSRLVADLTKSLDKLKSGNARTPALSPTLTKMLLDAVLGRDFEVRQVVDILTRRRQNNPILVGEAGVGKTAVVEGFAMRIVQGDVPPVLRNVTLRTLDLALLQAGAGVKGEFENRLKGLIEEVKSSPTPIIL